MGTPSGRAQDSTDPSSAFAETGLFPSFKSVPFAAEIYVKDRFDVLKAVEGAGQELAMPAS